MNQQNDKKPDCKTCYFSNDNGECTENKVPDSCHNYLIKDEFVMFDEKKKRTEYA